MISLRLKYSNLVFVIVLFALIFPTFKNILGNTLGYGLLHIILIYLIFQLVYLKKILLSKKIILFGIFTSIIILTSTIFNSKVIITKDFLEIHRPILYILTFYLPFLIKWDLSVYYKYIKILFVIFVFFVFLSINSSLSLSPEITGWYNSATHMHRSRFSGTFPNPYDFGYILLLPFFVSFINILSKSKTRIKLIYYFILIFSVLMLIGTQSRTSFLGLLIGFLYIIFLFSILLIKFQNLRFLKIILYFILIVTIAVPIIYIAYNNLRDNYNYLFVGIESFLLSGRTGSTDVRLVKFNEMIESFSGISDIVIGNGVSKGEMPNPESSYLLYPFRYGLYGVFFTYSNLWNINYPEF